MKQLYEKLCLLDFFNFQIKKFRNYSKKNKKLHFWANSKKNLNIAHLHYIMNLQAKFDDSPYSRYMKRYLPDFDHLQLQLRELTYIDKVRTTEQLVFFTISLAFFSPPMIMNFCPWDRILRSLLNPIWISLS